MQMTSLSLAITRRSGRARLPIDLFTSDAVKGAIYDYDDFAYLYQKSDGSVPVTALEQPVGLMLDKRYGGARGSELITDGDNEGGLFTAGSIVNLNTTVSRVANPAGSGFVARLSSSNGSSVPHQVNISSLLVAGKPYEISVDVYVPTGGVGTAKIFDNSDGSWFGPSTTLKNQWVTLRGIRVAKAGAWSLGIGNNGSEIVTNGAVAFYIDNISIRELPGLHAYQATDAARPVLSARYNLLLNTVFAGGAAAPTGWTLGVGTGASAPGASDGVNTSYMQSGVAGERPYIQQSVTLAANTSYTATATAHEATGCTVGDVLMSGSLPSGNRTFTKNGVAANVGDAIASGDTVTMVLSIGATGGSVVFRLGLGGGGPIAGAASIRFSKPDLRLTADANSRLPAYQRVTTANDYDSAGFPRFLRIDATDDFLQTASVDPGTDKVFVCAGVTKAQDGAAYQVVVESSAVSDTTNGAFNVGASTAQGDASRRTWAANVRGTTGLLGSVAGYSAPDTKIVSAILDISGASQTAKNILHLNGIRQELTYNNPNAGTGALTAQPLYIGARAGTSNRLNNGRIYPMVICFKAVTTGEIAATGQWLRARCPAVF